MIGRIRKLKPNDAAGPDRAAVHLQQVGRSTFAFGLSWASPTAATSLKQDAIKEARDTRSDLYALSPASAHPQYGTGNYPPKRVPPMLGSWYAAAAVASRLKGRIIACYPLDDAGTRYWLLQCDNHYIVADTVIAAADRATCQANVIQWIEQRSTDSEFHVYAPEDLGWPASSYPSLDELLTPSKAARLYQRSMHPGQLVRLGAIAAILVATYTAAPTAYRYFRPKPAPPPPQAAALPPPFPADLAPMPARYLAECDAAMDRIGQLYRGWRRMSLNCAGQSATSTYQPLVQPMPLSTIMAHLAGAALSAQDQRTVSGVTALRPLQPRGPTEPRPANEARQQLQLVASTFAAQLGCSAAPDGALQCDILTALPPTLLGPLLDQVPGLVIEAVAENLDDQVPPNISWKISARVYSS